MTIVTGKTLAELSVPVPGYDRRVINELEADALTGIEAAACVRSPSKAWPKPIGPATGSRT
jgi:hypothetical protein